VFSFHPPDYERMITALAHPNPHVRRSAATALLWDEPAAAEGPLLGATRDPDPRVAAEAVNTLQYYPSRRVLSRLHELREHPHETVGKEAAKSLGELRWLFLIDLHARDRRVASHVRDWLAPVWDILAYTAEDLRPEEAPTPGRTPERELHARPVA